MTKPKPVIINKNSNVGISLVLTLCGIAFSAGALWMKIDNFDVRMVALEQKVEEIHDYLKPDMIGYKD